MIMDVCICDTTFSEIYDPPLNNDKYPISNMKRSTIHVAMMKQYSNNEGDEVNNGDGDGGAAGGDDGGDVDASSHARERRRRWWG